MVDAPNDGGGTDQADAGQGAVPPIRQRLSAGSARSWPPSVCHGVPNDFERGPADGHHRAPQPVELEEGRRGDILAVIADMRHPEREDGADAEQHGQGQRPITVGAMSDVRRTTEAKQMMNAKKSAGTTGHHALLKRPRRRATAGLQQQPGEECELASSAS